MSFLPPDPAEWSYLTHEQLYSQIHTGPGSAAALAAHELWGGAGEVLESGHARITTALTNSGEGWTGSAADAARSGLGPLTDWALSAVDDAQATMSAVITQGDHAERLRTLMPPPNTADVEAAKAAVAAAPPRFGPGLETSRLTAVQVQAQNLSDDAFRLMRDYADRSDHNAVDLDRWSAPPAVTVDAAPIGVASAGTPVRTSPTGLPGGSPTAAAGGGRGVVDRIPTVAAGGADAGGVPPMGAATLLPGYGGRGGRPATSGQPAGGTAVRNSGAGSLPLGTGPAAASRPGTPDRPGVGRTGDGTGIGDPKPAERAATARPGVISSDPSGSWAAPDREPEPLRSNGPGSNGLGPNGQGSNGLGSNGPGSNGLSSNRLGSAPGRPGTPGYEGAPARGPGASGLGGEAGWASRGPGTTGPLGDRAGAADRWSAAPAPEPSINERAGTGAEPYGSSSGSGRGNAGSGLYPPMVGGGAAGQDRTHRRPDWLVDDSGAFEDHRWFPPAVLHPDDPLPPPSPR